MEIRDIIFKLSCQGRFDGEGNITLSEYELEELLEQAVVIGSDNYECDGCMDLDEANEEIADLQRQLDELDE